MEDEADWGLQAVVRSCGAGASCSSSSRSSYSAVASGAWGGPLFGLPPSNPPSINEEKVGALGNRHLACFNSASTDYDVNRPFTELEELFTPFYPKPAGARHQQAATNPPQPAGKTMLPEEGTTTLPPPTPHLFSAFPAAVAGKQPLVSPRQHQARPRGMGHGAPLKRRKNQVKKVVCQVPTDALCSDVWAWRKYGQKPIKGSPFPRGYYRCSSSKGCPARKQVERSRTDPGMFVLTYTSDHNHPVPTHRSCLAGSTRNKSPPPQMQMPPPPLTKPSVSRSPLSSVEEDVLAGAGIGPLPHSDRDDDEDGLLVLSDGMDVDDMLGAVEELDDGDDEALRFSPPTGGAFCSPPLTSGPQDGVCNTWSRNNHHHGHGDALPFAATSR